MIQIASISFVCCYQSLLQPSFTASPYPTYGSTGASHGSYALVGDDIYDD